MNEQIQELYTEALKYADSVVPPENRYNDVYYAIVCGKHGELILKECINTILFSARWYQEVEKDDNTVIALCDLVKDIREEYGVE